LVVCANRPESGKFVLYERNFFTGETFMD